MGDLAEPSVFENAPAPDVHLAPRDLLPRLRDVFDGDHAQITEVPQEALGSGHRRRAAPEGADKDLADRDRALTWPLSGRGAAVHRVVEQAIYGGGEARQTERAE